MRDSAIFYRSFYEAIKELPSGNQLEVYNAVFEYALNFNAVELTGLSKTIFTLIKPQLEANIGKYKNGIKAKNKQKRSKKEANENVNDNLNENNNVNNKENVNEHADDKYLFESFWNLYNKKVERSLCESKWKKLTAHEQQLIINGLPLYIRATPDVQYRKNPATYLANRVWEDEHLPFVKPVKEKSAFQKLVETGEY